MSDRASQVIARGDPEEILRMALGARFAAEEGRYCECGEPSLHGRDLMCGNCLLENRSQIESLERAMKEPHPFEPDPLEESAAARLGMCGLCAHWRDDPRHVSFQDRDPASALAPAAPSDGMAGAEEPLPASEPTT